jgi:hypothetical protein
VRDDTNANDVPPTNGDPPPTLAPKDAAQALADLWPPLPNGITIAGDVDLTADDPTLVPEPVNAGQDKHSHRRCIATRRDGKRCATRAMHSSLLCPLHAGRMTPSQGHQARKTQAAEREARTASVLQLQKLGTRAVVAEALVAEAEKVDRAVRHLVDAAANGDIAAAKALIPWIDQAFGRPTERHELRVPSSVEEIEQLSTEELESLVARGRAKRLALQAAPEPAGDWRRRDPPLGVVDDDVVADD